MLVCEVLQNTLIPEAFYRIFKLSARVKIELVIASDIFMKALLFIIQLLHKTLFLKIDNAFSEFIEASKLQIIRVSYR